MTTSNGGPAFPVHGDVLWQGMTLRDYFAAKAMQAMACAPIGKFQHTSGIELCRDAYAMADAMLKAREV